MYILSDELDLWGEAGLCARFWWRDDDAGSPRPEFSRMLDLTQHLGIPVCLSVIPAAATVELLDRASEPALISILQHGWSHTNHEPEDLNPSELGDARPPRTAIKDLERGRSRLIELFGLEPVQPALVPPWHSISLQVATRLPQITIHSVSLLGRFRSPFIAPGVVMINTDVDLIRWAGEPCFIGREQSLIFLTACLRDRRLAVSNAADPVGLLTHHWALDSDAVGFLEELGRMINNHPAAQWVQPRWPDGSII